MNKNLSFDTNPFIKLAKSNICNFHNEKYELYCKTCSCEFCKYCLKFHSNHHLINYNQINPSQEEIELLINTMKKYIEDYNNLLTEIFSWKKILDKMITDLINQIKNNKRINDNINFIYNISNNNYMNYKSIMKFRQLFNNMIEPELNYNNKKILIFMEKDDNINNEINYENNMGIFEYNHYNKMKICLNKIINNKKIENNFKFISNCIINILLENYIFSQKILNNNLINNNSNYHNNKNNIIEKYIDLSIHKKKCKIISYRNKENKNFEFNKTQRMFFPKIGNIFLQQNYLNSSFSNRNNNYNNNSKKIIYLKKRSNSNNNIFWNKDRKNISYNINEYNTNLNINKINFILQKEKQNISNESNKDSFSNGYLSYIKYNNKIGTNEEDRRKTKTFLHKKFEPINLKQLIKTNKITGANYSIKKNNYLKTPKYSNKSEKDKINENYFYFSSTSGNKLNSTYTDSKNIKQKLNFESFSDKKIINNDESLLLNNDLAKDGEIISPNINNYNNNNNSIRKFQISQTFKYSLSPNQTLCVGLEISNYFCKLGVINPDFISKNSFDSLNSIDLFCLKENIISIPFMISFNDYEIKIGHESNDTFLKDPSKTIFDIINLLGKNYDEILVDQELYSFKIYSEDNKPYIKINFHNKEKLFNFEDLFTIYMKKLFEKFFEKFELIDEENNSIQIILSIAIPDNINYFQRKIIEKIFQNQIFPSHTEINDSNIDNSDNISNTFQTSSRHIKLLYGGYHIILKNIIIGNSSSIIHLSYNSFEDKPKNILALVTNGELINISLSKIYKDNINNEIKNIYEIKNEINLQKGETILINNFIEKKMKEKGNIYNKDINKISNLKKICLEFISNMDNANYNDNKELKEFIKSLYNIYIDIISLIKELILKEKLNENNINYILIDGQILKTKIFIELLYNLFKDNLEIKNYLNNEYISEHNIIIGTTIQSLNLNLESPYYIFKNISPISFGIDSFGIMEFIIKKGTNFPVIKKKKVKIKSLKNEKEIKIKIYEGENIEINKNRIISYINIDKKHFKNEKIGEDYIELLIQFELDKYFNLRVFVLDYKSFKKRFECLINIDVIRG